MDAGAAADTAADGTKLRTVGDAWHSTRLPCMHWLLPAVATAASAAFATAVLRQYAARRRPYQLAWGVALAMFAVASLALTVRVAAA